MKNSMVHEIRTLMLEGANFVNFFLFSHFMNITFSQKKRQGPNYVNAKTFLFGVSPNRTLFIWRCPKMPKNMQKSSFTTCRVLCVGGASWGTLLTKGSHGDVSLWPKNAGKSWKWEEVKENYWKTVEKRWKKEKGRGKKGEKRKHWRKKEKGGEAEEKGGKERTRGKGRLGSPEGLYTMSQTSLEFCLPCPVHLCTKSDHVRTASGKKTKNVRKIAKKMHIWAERTLVRSPRQCNFWQPSTRERLGTDSARARVAQQLRKKPPKMPQNWPHTVLTTVQNHQKSHKNMARTSKWCPKIRKKYHKKRQNTTIWCPKLTNRGSYVSEIFQQGRFSRSFN